MSRRGYRYDSSICQICHLAFGDNDERIAWVCGRDFKNYVHKSCIPGDGDWLNKFRQAQREIKINKIVE